MARSDRGQQRRATARRHEAIMALLKAQGALSVNDLAEHFQCSTATIRRDLQILGRRLDDMRRFHGVVAMEPALLERGFQEKMPQSQHEKQAIAEAVVAFLPERGVVGMNGGTTTTMVARQLARHRPNLTVVTNAVNIAFELANSSVAVVVVGGAVRPSNYETTGSLALDTLRGLHLDWAVLGANGVDPRFGASCTTELEAAVGRAFALQADQVVAVVDHTKLAFNALFQMVPWSVLSWVASGNDAATVMDGWGAGVPQEGGAEAAVWAVNPRS